MFKYLRKISIKFVFIIFWIGLFFLFLFSSRFINIFRSQKTLTIFTFPLLVDAQKLSLFEKKTGIKLYIHYYENNDELVAKMLLTDNPGYDIIFPSDYAIKTLLQKKGLLQKIDKTKLNFIKKLRPELLGYYFDPKNEYSIPYQWEIYGIGYNKKSFGNKNPPATWKLVFDEKIGLKNMGMIDNAREVVALASFYLFGSIEKLTEQQLKKVKELLINQKKRVEAYTDERASYLLTSKTSSAAVCTAGDIWRANELGFAFILPEEGSFVVIDSICIPKGEKTDLVYQLINFLYEDSTMNFHAEEYSFWPATSTALVKEEGKILMNHALKNFNQFNFYKPVATEEQLDNIWIELKAD